MDQTSSQGSVCQTSSTSSYAASPSFHRAPAEGFGASSGTPRHAKQKLKQAGRVPAGTTTQLYQHSVHDIPLRSPQQRRDALIIRSRPPENNACPPAGLWLPWISLGGEQAWKMHGKSLESVRGWNSGRVNDVKITLAKLCVPAIFDFKLYFQHHYYLGRRTSSRFPRE